MKTKIIIATTLMLLISAMGLAYSDNAARKDKDAEYARKGQKLFMQYCASCHGGDAKGQGPVAIALKGGPRDLTLLQAPDKNFQFYQVQAWIEGEQEVSAHGTRKMPVWGTILRRAVGDLEKQADIYALVKYIESIQQHGKK